MMDTPSAPAHQVLDQDALAEIQGMKPWLRFMSVLGFICSAMCLLAGVIMIAAAALIPLGKGSASDLGSSSLLMVGLAILYILIAVPYLFLALHLHRAANTAGEVLEQPTSENLTAFLRHHRKFWKFLGIMAVVGFFLYTLAIVAAIVLPAVAKISKK